MTKHEVETDDEDAEEWEEVLLPSDNYKSALLTTEIIPKAFDPLNLDELKKYLVACLGASGFAVVLLLYVVSNLP